MVNGVRFLGIMDCCCGIGQNTPPLYNCQHKRRQLSAQRKAKARNPYSRFAGVTCYSLMQVGCTKLYHHKCILLSRHWHTNSRYLSTLLRMEKKPYEIYLILFILTKTQPFFAKFSGVACKIAIWPASGLFFSPLSPVRTVSPLRIARTNSLYCCSSKKNMKCGRSGNPEMQIRILCNFYWR